MSQKLPGQALIGTFSMASPAASQKFLEIIKEIAANSLKNEKGTITYYWTVPTGGDEKIIRGLEMFDSRYWSADARYEDRAAVDDLHMKATPVQKLINACQNENLLSGPPTVEYVTPVAGFLIRPGAPNYGNYPGSFVWTGKFVTQPGKTDEVVEALKENLPYIESSEPETISFLVFKGTDEPDTVYVWERYTSESALRDVHHKSAGYARLREKTGPLMKSREINGYCEVTGFLTREGGLIS